MVNNQWHFLVCVVTKEEGWFRRWSRGISSWYSVSTVRYTPLILPYGYEEGRVAIRAMTYTGEENGRLNGDCLDER